MIAALMFPSVIEAKPEKSPKLVVGIVIDQFDKESFEKMLPVIGSDGLKRLWIDGYNRTDATFDYDNTDRASAIASIYTGASPFQHVAAGASDTVTVTVKVSTP